MLPTQALPEILPPNPLVLAAEWLAEATRRGDQPNPNAMVLATCDKAGHPAARVVLCKEIQPEPGLLRFYTNYDSRKGRELTAWPRAAVVLHWDHLHRQVRVEGCVRRTTAADSDQYFASRHRESQLGAHASLQSQPVESRALLQHRLDEVSAHFAGRDVPRPQHWGGFELWAETVELWVEGAARLHDRARWTRRVDVGPDGPRAAGPWSATRLHP
ncbi:MAG: pyridoxamine 5'-phosphate oxidase [Steroidobacteraceae bacterium]